MEQEIMNLSQAIKEQVIMLASFSGREMNEMLLSGYMNAISDLDQGQVLDALKSWLRTNKGFPHPADIREKVMPEINPADDALDVANLIITSVGKYGWTNPDQARAFMGELGWTTVTRMGGWRHLCETLTQDNETTFRAQIKNYAETVRRKAMRGELSIAPALPSPQGESAQKLISTTFKTMENK
jgi:hypothetical protein